MRLEGHSLLFTPQRLFGEHGRSSDLLRHSAFLERARLEHERGGAQVGRFALSAYLLARLIDRALQPAAEQAVREELRWQRESVRQHLATLPADQPEVAHLSGILDAVPDYGRSSGALRIGLTAYAYFLEHEARLEEALAVLDLAGATYEREIPAGEFATYALFVGRLNRLLARWETARTCYAAAEEAGRAAHDSVAALRGRLGCGAVLRGQGNLPLAEATTRAVVEEAGALGLGDVQAMAYADLGAVHMLQGRQLEALEANYRAFRLTSDPVKRMRILGDLGIALREIGAHQVARLALEIVASSSASFLVRTNAVLELMDLEAALGNRVSFERCRSHAEGSRERMAPSMLVDYLYKSGVGLARFGQLTRARQALERALASAELHQLNAWYFRIEKVLGNLDACASEWQEPAAPAALSRAPIVQQMQDGLEEYAALAAAP